MKRNLKKVSPRLSKLQLLGIEGASAAVYWPALATLCRGAGSPFKRQRPAKDALNATINYLTWMLERDIRSVICNVGLHPGFGILHAANDRSDAAVYDLMEPFRASLTEGVAVFLFNSRRLKNSMFDRLDDGGIHISRVANKAIVSGYEQAVARRIKQPWTKNKASWRMVMKRQAQELAKAYRDQSPQDFRPYLLEA